MVADSRGISASADKPEPTTAASVSATLHGCTSLLQQSTFSGISPLLTVEISFADSFVSAAHETPEITDLPTI